MSPNNENPLNENHTEKSVLLDIIKANLKEQRRQHRWKIFFRLAFLGIIIAILVLAQSPQDSSLGSAKNEKHTALIKMEGIILYGSPAEADNIIDLLEEAFENENSEGVILYINSPGGSPVQAAWINQKIHELRDMYPDKPIHTVVSDICASGAYYVAAATSSIYANQSSLIGSIGVLYDGFGLTGLIEKAGIERRLMTAGKYKDMLDPFSPEKPETKQHVQELLNQMHDIFISAVQKGRGKRLKDDPDIFSGLIWAGEDSIRLGLIDAIGDADHVAKNVIGSKEIVEYKSTTSLVDRLSEQVSTRVKNAILEQALFPTLR